MSKDNNIESIDTRIGQRTIEELEALMEENREEFDTVSEELNKIKNDEWDSTLAIKNHRFHIAWEFESLYRDYIRTLMDGKGFLSLWQVLDDELNDKLALEIVDSDTLIAESQAEIIGVELEEYVDNVMKDEDFDIFLFTDRGHEMDTFPLRFGSVLHHNVKIYDYETNYDVFYSYHQNLYDYSKHLTKAVKLALDMEKKGKM